jgi:hypothetical protein
MNSPFRRLSFLLLASGLATTSEPQDLTALLASA